MTVSAGDVIRATFEYAIAGGTVAQNVYHYLADTGVSDSDSNVMNAITSALDTAYGLIDGNMATDVQPTNTVYAKRNPATGKWEQMGVRAQSNPTGSGGTTQIANGVCAVLRFLTAGLGEQGRKFISGWDGLQFVDNVMIAALQTLLTNFITSVTGSVAVSGGVMLPGWWSEKFSTHRAYDGNGLFSTVAGYQRRRKPGVGI